MAQDPTHGWVVEMGAEHGDRPVRIALAECAPRLPRLLHIGVKMATPAGLGDLDGVMQEVARDDGLAVPRREPHADVAGRVSRRGLAGVVE